MDIPIQAIGHLCAYLADAEMADYLSRSEEERQRHIMRDVREVQLFLQELEE